VGIYRQSLTGVQAIEKFIAVRHFHNPSNQLETIFMEGLIKKIRMIQEFHSQVYDQVYDSYMNSL
jgi:hypothetical protein